MELPLLRQLVCSVTAPRIVESAKLIRNPYGIRRKTTHSRFRGRDLLLCLTSPFFLRQGGWLTIGRRSESQFESTYLLSGCLPLKGA